MARTDERLFKVLLDLQADPLDPEIPDDVLDAMVRAEGGDPEAIASRTRALVEGETERQRLGWQDEARRRRDRLAQKAGAGRGRSRDGLSVEELLAEIEALKSDPKLQQSIALAARKRRPGEKPDAEELRMLLADLDQLRAMAADDSDDGDR